MYRIVKLILECVTYAIDDTRRTLRLALLVILSSTCLVCACLMVPSLLQR